jgi:hypothetical protein
MMTGLLAFLGVSALVICTPGPDTALTVRNSICRRTPRRRIHCRWHCCRAAGVDRRSELGHRWPVAGITARLHSAQDRWCGVLDLPRSAVDLGSDSRPPRQARAPNRIARARAATSDAPRVHQQSRQSQNGGLFPQLASSVRAGRVWPRCCSPSTRLGVLPHDIRLALALRRRPQQTGTIPATVPGASLARRSDRDCSSRLGSSTRDRNTLVVRGITAGPRRVCHL